MSDKSEQTPEAPATSFFKLTITLDPGNDPKPVELLVTYPKDQGMAAISAVHQLSGYAPSLGVTLAEKGDPSILAAMDEAGISLDDTEEKQP